MSIPEFRAFMQALVAILTRFQPPSPPPAPPVPTMLIPKELKSLRAPESCGEKEEDPMKADLWLNDVHFAVFWGMVWSDTLKVNVYSTNLISDPTTTLRLIWAIEFPVVILLFSCCRQKPENCSYLKAISQGLLGLPVGALLNALGALALGAPVGLQYFERTISWSLLMSSLTVSFQISIPLPVYHYHTSLNA
ncbi:uncharacterized protein LOC120151622 [Hibiscus syriacus]|uniref:uncharacterized protein LOC120151622 n=1 Tax=Hibiscus syriacus TaxID=106335 RepID=UPI001922CCF9|nr:uncharacterized protein LOC120151622 [Hibiscus syriacus]